MLNSNPPTNPVMHGQCDAKPYSYRQGRTEHDRPFNGTILHCLVT